LLGKKLQDLDGIESQDGTYIKQIFHPHNTLNGIRCSIAHSTVPPNKESRLHQMKTSEIYYILEGTGLIKIDGKVSPVSKDHIIYVPPMAKQSIKNNGTSDLKFLCIVDPAWRQEDEILLD